MAILLPPTGTHRLLELVSPYVPDAFIHDLCPRQFTGGRRCALSAPQLWRLHLLPLLTSTHSLNLVVAQLSVCLPLQVLGDLEQGTGSNPVAPTIFIFRPPETIDIASVRP